MLRHSNKTVTPAVREVVIFSIMGIGYIYAVWLVLDGRFVTACISIAASLLGATFVDKGWRLNRRTPPVKPRHQHGLLVPGHLPRRNRNAHPPDRQVARLAPHGQHLNGQTGDPSP